MEEFEREECKHVYQSYYPAKLNPEFFFPDDSFLLFFMLREKQGEKEEREIVFLLSYLLSWWSSKIRSGTFYFSLQAWLFLLAYLSFLMNECWLHMFDCNLLTGPMKKKRKIKITRDRGEKGALDNLDGRF